jgi:hypothetical protein
VAHSHELAERNCCLLSPGADPCHFRRETMKPGNDLARVNLAERLIATKGRPSGFPFLGTLSKSPLRNCENSSRRSSGIISP